MKTLVLLLLGLVPLTQCVSILQAPRQHLKKDWPQPPPWPEKATMARYLVHYAVWGIVSAISPEYDHRPFGSVQSFADGPLDKSSGVPYLYIANVSDTYHNIQFNNSVSLSITQAEGHYCDTEGWDAEEPLCARMVLFGRIVPVKDTSGSTEWKFAQQSLFARHPAMKGWPMEHGWSIYKLAIEKVLLLDFYGGATNLSVKEYYAAHP